MLGLSPFGGGSSCRHTNPDGDVGSGPTKILQESSLGISLGSESGVASMGVDPLDVDGESGSLLPALEMSDSLSSAEMDEKLTSEWELDVRKKVAWFWERLSQEYAWKVSEEHNERFRAITEEMIKRQKTKGKKELLNLQSFVNYDDSKTSSKCRKGKIHVM
jgi:hypothetical protein